MIVYVSLSFEVPTSPTRQSKWMDCCLLCSQHWKDHLLRSVQRQCCCCSALAKDFTVTKLHRDCFFCLHRVIGRLFLARHVIAEFSYYKLFNSVNTVLTSSLQGETSSFHNNPINFHLSFHNMNWLTLVFSSDFCFVLPLILSFLSVCLLDTSLCFPGSFLGPVSWSSLHTCVQNRGGKWSILIFLKLWDDKFGLRPPCLHLIHCKPLVFTREVE